MTMRSRWRRGFRWALACVLAWPLAVAAQDNDSGRAELPLSIAGAAFFQRTGPDGQTRSCFFGENEEPDKEQEVKALAGLPTKYWNWLAEDAVYIISPDERCAFLHLGVDEERDQFIEQFWLRRSSNPDSPDNDFKEEHYRRITLANAKFAADIEGWQTDRGRVYIVYGRPDGLNPFSDREIFGSLSEEWTETAQYPCQKWHYRYLEGIGENIDLGFSTEAGTDDCRLVEKPSEVTLLPTSIKLESEPSGGDSDDFKSKRSLEVYIRTQMPIVVNYKDLEAIVVSEMIRDDVYFEQGVVYARATHASTFGRIRVDIPGDQLSRLGADGTSTIGYALFGQITGANGRVADTFERTGKWDAEGMSGYQNAIESAYVVLEPGSYQLAIVVKDLASGRVGVKRTTMDVPRFEELAAKK